MSHTATDYETPPYIQNAVPGTGRNVDSLLASLLSRLIRIARDYRAEKPAARNPVGFLEENLTDPLIGPEIHRALR